MRPIPLRDEKNDPAREREPVEDHGFDGMAGGDDAHLRVLPGRLVNDLSDAKFVKHACDEAQMSQDLAAVDVLSVHRALLCW
jgi:hypothetical protein